MSNVIYKKIEGCKDGALHKLMNNVEHAKTMENLRNRIDARLVSKGRDYLRWALKPSHMSYNIFDNDLINIPKS